jgi:hypothetical protein
MIRQKSSSGRKETNALRGTETPGWDSTDNSVGAPVEKKLMPFEALKLDFVGLR